MTKALTDQGGRVSRGREVVFADRAIPSPGRQDKAPFSVPHERYEPHKFLGKGAFGQVTVSQRTAPDGARPAHTRA